MRSFADPAVARVFSTYAPTVRKELLKVRELIFATAKGNPAIGTLEETLKWGQPSYLTAETKSGSTLRIDAFGLNTGGYAMYFHCQTDLVKTFSLKFGRKFRYEGNRALLFSAADKIPEAELSECITSALTYHLKKRKMQTPIGQLINQTRG